MILSISYVPVADATRENVFGAWSNLQVGERPEGLVDCYLLESDGVIQIASIWATKDHHEQAIQGPETHPGRVVFTACGLDPTHNVYKVVGRLK